MATKLETTLVNVSRSFDHKAHGRIGLVNMEAAIAYVAIDGKQLPATSVEYLLTFALQNLQDSYAGAESAEDATARFDKKLQRLIEGTIGVREAGAGVSAEIKTRRVVMGELLRKSEKGKAALKAREDDRDVFLDEVFAKQPQDRQDAIMAEVAQRVEAAKAKAKQAAKLADAIEL